jgi:sulfite oxidase
MRSVAYFDDVTEFIEQHPGQEKILLASGGALEPFWGMYRQHYHSTVVRILEEYRIGNLSKQDQISPTAKDPNDPYLISV